MNCERSVSCGERESLRVELDDLLDGGRDIVDEEIVMIVANPGGFDEDRGAAGDLGGLGVLPFVRNDKRLVQIERPFEGGLHEQSGLGFAAGVGFVVVGADENVIDRNFAPEDGVHEVEFVSGQKSLGNSGLVGCNDEEKSRAPERSQQITDLFVDTKLFESERCDLTAITHGAQIEDPISLQKHGGFHKRE
jgi:hypothetical protein